MVRNSGLSRRRSRTRGMEFNPIEGVANLADIMLVFSCGLMISIISFWQVDLSRITNVISQEELMEIKDVEEAIEDGSLSDALESKGFAYEDPETGKLYIIKQ